MQGYWGKAAWSDTDLQREAFSQIQFTYHFPSDVVARLIPHASMDTLDLCTYFCKYGALLFHNKSASYLVLSVNI